MGRLFLQYLESPANKGIYACKRCAAAGDTVHLARMDDIMSKVTTRELGWLMRTVGVARTVQSRLDKPLSRAPVHACARVMDSRRASSAAISFEVGAGLPVQAVRKRNHGPRRSESGARVSWLEAFAMIPRISCIDTHVGRTPWRAGARDDDRPAHGVRHPLHLLPPGQTGAGCWRPWRNLRDVEGRPLKP